VIVRGIEGRPIFADDRDRQDLVERLSRILPECGARCYAWALMPNHAHLVVRTGHRPLARLMARIGTGYAGGFNRRHDRIGHLFHNRYKSLLVPDDPYFLTLVRYVHLNPVRAGIVSLGALRRYPWTGHAVLLGEQTAVFQDARFVLDRFDRSLAQARARLEAWMRAEDPTQPESEQRRPSIRTALDALIGRVGGFFGASRADLAAGGRLPTTSAARAVIAHLACDGMGIPQQEVGRALGVSGSAVGRARGRGRELVAAERSLAVLAAPILGGGGSTGSARSVPEVRVSVQRPRS
jgi:REP element-mobilizing transposase RayT